MSIPITAWIARRYLSSASAGRYAPLLTATAIAGVAVGTMALIVVMSVMRGFREELASRLMGFDAHITLTREADGRDLGREDVERMLGVAVVRDVAPFVEGEAIATSTAGGDTAVLGVRVRGVDPDQLGALEGVELYMPESTPDIGVLANQDNEGLPPVVIGSEIVGLLMVHPDFGDAVEMTAPLAEVGPTGELMPQRRRFRVAGVFRAGVYDYDSKYMLVGLEEASRLLGEQAREGWQVRLEDTDDLPKALAAVRAKLPEGWLAAGFDEHNRKLFAALRLERVAMTAILIMVLIIASCSIAGVVLLITAAKRKDVAILQSLGMSEGRVRRIFLDYAALIGVAGAGVGLAGGIVASLAADRWPVTLPDSYYLEYLPVDLSVGYALLFAAVGVAVAVVASLYPMRQVTRQSPAEVLRYE